MNETGAIHVGDYHMGQVYPYGPYVAPYTGGNVSMCWPSVPTECSGDVHVFVCKKCGECKCGMAKLGKRK